MHSLLENDANLENDTQNILDVVQIFLAKLQCFIMATLFCWINSGNWSSYQRWAKPGVGLESE